MYGDCDTQFQLWGISRKSFYIESKSYSLNCIANRYNHTQEVWSYVLALGVGDPTVSVGVGAPSVGR